MGLTVYLKIKRDKDTIRHIPPPHPGSYCVRRAACPCVPQPGVGTQGCVGRTTRTTDTGEAGHGRRVAAEKASQESSVSGLGQKSG